MLKGINRVDFIKKWAISKLTVYTCDFFGKQYYQALKSKYKFNLSHNLFIYNKGRVVCYQSQNENEKLGEFIGRLFLKDHKYLDNWIKEINERTEIIENLINKPINHFLDLDKYNKFVTSINEYLPYFVGINRSADFVSEYSVKKLKILEKVRLRTEEVYKDTDLFIENYFKYIAKIENIDLKYVMVLFTDELLQYLRHNQMPSKSILAKRIKYCGLYYSMGKRSILSDLEVKNFIENVSKINSKKKISGKIAYSGVVKGEVKIVNDPKKCNKFKEGNILVAVMTRPDYLPLMKKAAGFITDAGGILCHAAITARELKTPCIIGTEIATKVLKDGDIVELDANNGIIRKL